MYPLSTVGYRLDFFFISTHLAGKVRKCDIHSGYQSDHWCINLELGNSKFYMAFWPELKTYLMDTYKEAIKEGTMFISQKRGVIYLIPKASKDPEELKNWKPITLLNQDYKYLEKCVANRCKDLVLQILSTDQSGIVNGRCIGTNIIRTET